MVELELRKVINGYVVYINIGEYEAEACFLDRESAIKFFIVIEEQDLRYMTIQEFHFQADNHKK